MKLQLVNTVATVALMLVGCGTDTGRNMTLLPASPSSVGLNGARSVTATATAAIDISGSWSFTEIVKLQMPIEVIEQFGVPLEPEGHITHLTCENSGIAEFVQTGSAFSGTQETTLSRCVTGGGQLLEGFFTQNFEVIGRIEGRSVHAEDPLANCPATLVVSMNGVVATHMSGRANCHGLLPGGVLNTVTIDYFRL